MLHVTENSVNPVPATRERLQAPDFASGAANIARGAEALGQGISDATQNLDKIGEVYDTAAVKQADAEDMDQVTQIRADVMASKGFDTQTAIADARQKLEGVRKARLASLKNPRQREMYADVFDRRNMQLEESFASHSASQIAEANQAAGIARGEKYSDLAVQTFGTPAFDDNLGTVMHEVEAVNSGMGADAIQRKKEQAKSNIVYRAISGVIADPDKADEAQGLLDKHAADLLPDDEEKLRRMINPIREENRTQSDAGWAFTNDAIPGNGKVPEHPSETPEAPPRMQITTTAKTPEGQPSPYYPQHATSPADPLRGKGRITDNAAAHRARGSGNALDIAAPQGTPIYPPMSGKVVKSWWDKKGGWSVLVEHPNGYVTGYAHLRSQSPISEGQTVENDTVIGSVGATGDATGPHVHYTVRQSRGGPKVDPSAVLWDGKGANPNNVSWKEAEPVKYTAENNSLDRALTRLHERAVAENWGSRRYDKAVSEVRQIAGVQEQLYTQQKEDRYNAAVQVAVNLHEKFTNTSQIPNFGLLTPQQQYSLQGIADANKKALQGDQVKPNGDRYLMLMGMAQSPEYRQQFLSVDLGAETAITHEERAKLLSQQIKLKHDPTGPLAANLNTVEAYANRYLPKSVYKGSDGELKRRTFSDAMAAAIERQQQALGQPLTDRQTDDIARSLTIKVVRPGGAEAFGFEVRGSGKGGTVDFEKAWNSIAPDIRQNIANDLQKKGLPHDHRDVVAEWLRSRSR